MKRNKLKSALKVQNVCTYIQNKEIRNRIMFCFMPDGSSYYLFNGKILSKKELDEKYPVDIHLIRRKGPNVDGTKRYYE